MASSKGGKLDHGGAPVQFFLWHGRAGTVVRGNDTGLRRAENHPASNRLDFARPVGQTCPLPASSFAN